MRQNLREYCDTNFNIDLIKSPSYNRISVAPMMKVTNRQFRFFMRLLTKRTTLWTEMVHANELIHNPYARDMQLTFEQVEHPLVFQLGGNEPEAMAKAALMCQEQGADEVNINVGCPSTKVKKGCFGASLMKNPDLVGDCVAAMEKVCDIPVTVKTRLGVDLYDSYEFAKTFVDVIKAKTQIKHFQFHARKAWLNGLSPAENRNIPPLMYDRVYQLANDYPDLEISINGGFKTYDQIDESLKPEHKLKGVMIGRAAFQTPWLFADMDRRYYGCKNPGLSRKEILYEYGDYADHLLNTGMKKYSYAQLMKPIISLFANEPHQKVYRRCLSDSKFYKQFDTFSDTLKNAVIEYEKLNPDGMNLKPNLDDPTEMML